MEIIADDFVSEREKSLPVLPLIAERSLSAVMSFSQIYGGNRALRMNACIRPTRSVTKRRGHLAGKGPRYPPEHP